MAFSQTGISDVRVIAESPDLFVAWSSTLVSGTVYQVYVARRLAWYGRSLRCHVPIPSGMIGSNLWIEVCSVDASESTTDFSTSLIAPGGRTERAQLSWSGGTYLDPTGQDDIYAFGIFQSPSAGAPVDLSTVIDTVVAYPGGWINDGFGKGGFGEGGFGRAATFYQWESGPLTSGIWQFSVVAIDKAGHYMTTPMAISVTITAAPRPPALDSLGNRLSATYPGPSSPYLTLNWLDSPTE